MEKEIRPTESELEILQVLWESGSATVRTVHEQLSSKKDVFYTTTLKTMQVMHEKGLLDRDTSSRSHIYSPLVTQSIVQSNLISKLKETVFGGSTRKLILSAIGGDRMTENELKELKSLIEKLDND